MVAAAFADDPAALAAIADMGASTAMFQAGAYTHPSFGST